MQHRLNRNKLLLIIYYKFQKIFKGQRIVEGTQAATNSWPWIARLEMNSELYGNKGADSCVGTIIDDKTIVTAAYLGCHFFQLSLTIQEFDLNLNSKLRTFSKFQIWTPYPHCVSNERMAYLSTVSYSWGYVNWNCWEDHNKTITGKARRQGHYLSAVSKIIFFIIK